MDFRVSELEVTETIRTKDGSRTQVIFKGLFFVADTESPLRAKTFLLNDYAERMLGKKLGGFLQSKNTKRGNVVRFDDEYFEKHYVVYSDDEDEARQIFSQDEQRRDMVSPSAP